MAPPLEEESEVNFLHEGAATAVKAAENLTRSLSHNVQWGMDAAAEATKALVGAGPPKRPASPPPSPPAAAAPAAAPAAPERQATRSRSILRRSGSSVSSGAGHSSSPQFSPQLSSAEQNR